MSADIDSTPKIVVFGAGNIGRGFIAPLFSAAEYSIVFIDLDQQRVHALNDAGTYSVYEVFNDEKKEIAVSPVSGITASDQDAVATAIAEADILACAVGLHALPYIAPVLAAGLKQRWQQNVVAIDILVCENGLEAASILHQALTENMDAAYVKHLNTHFACVRTSIGRMIPPNRDSDSLDIAVEPYCYLPCDAEALSAPVPQMPQLHAVQNFDLIIQQKLYLHNCTHACLAYLGSQNKYTTIPQCTADADLQKKVRACGAEIIAALVQEHGASCRQQCEKLLDDLMLRYSNSALADTVSRVCRDPLRKLLAGDRLLGAAALCWQHHLPATHLYECIYAACQYRIEDDDNGATEWCQWQQRGAPYVLTQASGLAADSALLRDIHRHMEKMG